MTIGDTYSLESCSGARGVLILVEFRCPSEVEGCLFTTMIDDENRSYRYPSAMYSAPPGLRAHRPAFSDIPPLRGSELIAHF